MSVDRAIVVVRPWTATRAGGWEVQLGKRFWAPWKTRKAAIDFAARQAVATGQTSVIVVEDHAGREIARYEVDP